MPGEGVEHEGGDLPILPPIKTNRWLISKTFLKAKASSAANTVATSLHQRSASGPYLGRPSNASEAMPRPSQCSSSGEHHAQPNTADANTPFGFLQYDPAVTSRFGHFRHQSASQAELQPTTPRSITFTAEARATSPLPERNNGILSRMTDHSRLSGDAPRPSMGSFVSVDSVSTETHGPASYLGAARLFGNGRGTTLSKREARKAGARMGGHLLGCVASWTLVLPFLIYKIGQPAVPTAPLYSLLLVSLGISLSGPLLAVQTALADGFWYKKDLPLLMASSSAVAFEHIESRANTPAFTGPIHLAPSGHPALQAAQAQVQAKSPTPSNSANTESTSTTSTATHHRSNESRGSSSSISLASIAAFSNPAPGTFRHSEDTREAPTSLVAKALYMAAPHPKLQIISRGLPGGGEQAEKQDGQGDAGDWKKKEARKLKSFS